MINYSDNLWLYVRWKGSVLHEAIGASIPAFVCAVAFSHLDEWFPNFRKNVGLDDITESSLWNAMTAVIIILLGFRSRQALGRFWEGTGLLHQMRGEWFDAASCLITFSRDAKTKGKAEEVEEFRHTLVRLMSLMHGSALDEISDKETDSYDVLDLYGLDTKTLKFLRDCKALYKVSKVEVLQHMIQVLVTHNHHSGVLTIPAPVLSRCFQTLSRGLVNLLNARKIKDTMFPMPYAQTLKILLLVHAVFTPALMTQIVKSKIMAAALSFFPLFGMHCINSTCWQLEMPFGSDTNDLPLHEFQKEMNEVLLMLIHNDSDHLPCTSKHAVRDFESLAKFAEHATAEHAARVSSTDLSSISEKSLRGKSDVSDRSSTSSKNRTFNSTTSMRSHRGTVSHTKSFMSEDFFSKREDPDGKTNGRISSGEEGNISVAEVCLQHETDSTSTAYTQRAKTLFTVDSSLHEHESDDSSCLNVRASPTPAFLSAAFGLQESPPDADVALALESRLQDLHNLHKIISDLDGYSNRLIQRNLQHASLLQDSVEWEVNRTGSTFVNGTHALQHGATTGSLFSSFDAAQQITQAATQNSTNSYASTAAKFDLDRGSSELRKAGL